MTGNTESLVVSLMQFGSLTNAAFGAVSRSAFPRLKSPTDLS